MRLDGNFRARLRALFTPKKLQAIPASDAPASFTVLSGNYFSVANALRTIASGDTGTVPIAGYVFAAVVMYVAAFEAFLQEHLTLSLFSLEKSKGEDGVLRLLEQLKMQEKPYRDFGNWVKEIYRIYSRSGSEFDTNSAEYQNLLALRELRNSVAHYNPAFVSHMLWPARLEQALHRSKLEVVNSGWTTNFGRIEIATWGHDTVKAAVLEFCRVSGAANPFEGYPPIANWE
jgi:hypothetical protein